MKRKRAKSGLSMHSGTSNRFGSRRGALNRDIQGKLGQILREMYDDVVKEDVPDHLVDLVKRYEKSGGEGPRS
jgi:hypothetical protein